MYYVMYYVILVAYQEGGTNYDTNIFINLFEFKNVSFLGKIVDLIDLCYHYTCFEFVSENLEHGFGCFVEYFC